MALLSVLGLFCMGLTFQYFIHGQVQRMSQTLPPDGCENPVSYEHTDPQGKDLSKLGDDAMQRGRFLDFTEELYTKYGPTFKTINGGNIWIKTKDPELSKAVYATFFKKFGLQPICYERDGFLGDDILVMYGVPWKHSRA